MKITAEFENVDFAERAGNKVRYSVDNISKIMIYTKDKASDDLNFGYTYPANNDDFMGSYMLFSNNFTLPTPGPVMGYINMISPPVEPQFTTKAYITINCDDDKARQVSTILTGNGGQNIKTN